MWSFITPSIKDVNPVAGRDFDPPLPIPPLSSRKARSFYRVKQPPKTHLLPPFRPPHFARIKNSSSLSLSLFASSLSAAHSGFLPLSINNPLSLLLLPLVFLTLSRQGTNGESIYEGGTRTQYPRSALRPSPLSLCGTTLIFSRREGCWREGERLTLVSAFHPRTRVAEARSWY